MCIESLDTFLEYDEIQIQTKLFLDNNFLIEDMLKKLLTNEDEFYFNSLQGDKLDKFKLNLEGHFQWIKDKCIIDDDTIIFTDYDSNFEPSLKQAYCDFYYITNNYIKEVKQPRQIKENLEDYFCAFIKQYCTNKDKHCK